jgi:type I restriction enzyme S subunit
VSKWPVYSFEDVFLDDTRNGTKIKKENYLSIGTYPIIDQGREYIAGYTNQSDGLYHDVPAIIFGDHTRIVKIIDQPFFLGADGVKILKSKFVNRVDYRFLFYFLSNVKIPDTGYNRHFKWLKDLLIPIPPLDIQQQIVRELDTVSELLALRIQQLEELEQLIKSVFYEMFGDPIRNEHGWEKKSISEISVINPHKSELGNLADDARVSFVPMNSVSETGEIDTSQTREFHEVKTGYTYFRENDVLFAKITPCMENGKGAVARNLCNGIGFGSTEFHVLRPIEDMTDSEWLYRLTSLPFFRTLAEKNMTGSAGQKRVPASFFDKLRVGLPPLTLQQKYADIVNQIETKKSLVRQSIDETQRLFDSLMSKYFDD